MQDEAPVYLDCNATTPIEPVVLEAMQPFLAEEYGNAGSRTHAYGARAKKAVETARRQVADLLGSQPDEVIFTSGATESNNIAILGLAAHGRETDCRHIISTQIEHKAVLEPLDAMRSQGFDITLLAPTEGGWVDPNAVREALREDTILVSVMHANNETGILQPIREIASCLDGHPAYFHVDAAQTFGKVIDELCDPRIDLLSASAHKIYGPKGIGALLTRRRKYRRPPLTPLTFGGGQEHGLRPGTLPVPLCVGLGEAARAAAGQYSAREQAVKRYREALLSALATWSPVFHGDQQRCMPHVVNLRFDQIDSEALIVALKDIVAISNGSACTSESYDPSHVLRAMGLGAEETQCAVRLSWCHATAPFPVAGAAAAIRQLR